IDGTDPAPDGAPADGVESGRLPCGQVRMSQVSAFSGDWVDARVSARGRPRGSGTELAREVGKRAIRTPRGNRIGKTTALLEPLADAIGRHVLGGQAIIADDTPVAMLARGTGKTQTARLWAYVRDEHPWGGKAPPAAWDRFSGDRKGQHPE